MIKRVVLVKTDRPTQVDAELARLANLKGAVPCLRDIEVATDTSGRCLGYDRMFTLTFGKAEDITAWRDHPAHIPLRNALLRDAELLVFEYEVDERIALRNTSQIAI